MITQDHVVGGSVAVLVSANLPPVLAATHWLGPDAPVSNETQLIIGLGIAAYAVARYLLGLWHKPAQPAA